MDETGFVYETLGALVPSSPLSGSDGTATAAATFDCGEPDGFSFSYNVLRNEIGGGEDSDRIPTTLATEDDAVDYFPLQLDPLETPPRLIVPVEEVEDGEEDEKRRGGEEEKAERSGLGLDFSFESGAYRRIKSPMLQLHKEIVDFCDFVAPTQEEQASRAAAVNRIFEVIKYIWPHCEMEVFGSFKTGLYLPTSDIDVVILNSNIQNPQIGLRALSRALSQKNLAKNIQVIGKARVPIIKFVEKQSAVAFDISFDTLGGPEAAKFIKDAVAKLCPLRPLSMILKLFLQQRGLNEVYSGGLGSYALLVMLIAYIQMQWKGQGFHGGQRIVEHNLGILLVKFFEFYGRKLNTSDVGISCNAGGAFFLKSSKGFMKFERPHLISIEDPQEPTNDIGKNSYNFSQVRSAFAAAYSTLTDARTLAALGPKRSILGLIIRPDPTLLERKAGVNGELTFDALFPGAGDPVERERNGRKMLFNWQSDGSDDALPRNRKGDKLEQSLQKSIKKKKLRKRKGEDGVVASSKSKHRRRKGEDFAKESPKKITHSKAEREGGSVKKKRKTKQLEGYESGPKDRSRDRYRGGARSWAPY
ncbi:uncharacterized protein LOC116260864 [Nymphaea colorata]|nr:uncharacterized protein LOC116260864 [Nymphaea colorata]